MPVQQLQNVPYKPIAPAPYKGSYKNPADEFRFHLNLEGNEVRAYAAMGDYAKVKQLLDNGADPSGVTRGRKFYNDTSNVFFAASENDLTLMKILLDAGADPNFKTQQGFTPLLEAVSQVNPQTVRMLVRGGADVNACDNEGLSPLKLAMERGSGKPPYQDKVGAGREILAILKQAGAKEGNYKPHKLPLINRAIEGFMHIFNPDW